MKPLSARQLIQDIQLCIHDILELTAGFTFHQYVSTKAVRLSVERQLITIGEALNRLKRVSGDTKSRIDRTMGISSFRNFLVHEYEAIDDEEVWNLVQRSIPLLKQQIDAWAAELGMESPPE